MPALAELSPTLPHPRGQTAAFPAFTRIQPRKFECVPTHVVGFPQERRDYPRAVLSLPLRLKRVAGQRQAGGTLFQTLNISSSGAYFLSSRAIAPGTPVELEINLVDRPSGRGSVRMCTEAHVVRLDDTELPGAYGLAVAFDEISFYRDEAIVLHPKNSGEAAAD